MSQSQNPNMPTVQDPDSDESIWAEFGGEIPEEEGFHRGPELIHPAVTEAAAWSPYAYAAVLNRLLDKGLQSLTGSAGRLFLQLVRETMGRGRQSMSMSLEGLRNLTGLQKSTLIRAIDELHVAELVTVSPGTSHIAASYQVNLSKIPKVKDDDVPIPSRFSIEYRLSELSDEDRAELVAVERGLTPVMRKEICMAVRLEFLFLGQTRPDPEQFKQAVRYQTLHKFFAPARLRKAYPHWYEPPASI
jgi:hypothetical protein